MARPVKRRRVCGLPPVGAFRPEGGPGGPVIEVTVDEYEAVRLIDLLGLTQEECAAQMNVARTTVQAIYDSAREKLARMLAEGRPLAVQGGTYDLCGQAGGGPLPGTVWSGTEQDETGGTEHENSSDI